MYKSKNLFVLFATLLLSGCIFNSGERWRDQPYVVSWIDIDENLVLRYEVEEGEIARVGAKIGAVGSNEKYVVVKQYPLGTLATANYYFIDKTKDSKYAATEAVFGPFSDSDFKKKKIELDLPEFSKEFK